MNWFLRLFGAYRRLAASVEVLQTEKLILQDRLDGALQDRDRVWESFQAALAGERLAYQMQINHAVQKAGGGVPYPDAHSLPSGALPKQQAPGAIGRGSRMLFSESAARHNRQFIEELVSSPSA